MDSFMMNAQAEDFEEFTLNDYFKELEDNFFQAVKSLVDYSIEAGIGASRGAARETYEQLMADDDVDMKKILKSYGIVSWRTFEVFLKGAKFMLEKGEENEQKEEKNFK